MKKLLTLFFCILIFSCDNGKLGGGDSTTGTTDSQTLTAPLFNPGEVHTGLKLVNQSSNQLTFYIGTKEENSETILWEKVVGINESVIVSSLLPVDTPVDIWFVDDTDSIFYYKAHNDSRLDKKYIFKSDGSYDLTISTGRYLDYDYEFNCLKEDSTVVRKSFLDKDKSDIYFIPEIHTYNPSYISNPFLIDEGNLWLSDGNWVYGLYKISNPSDRKFEYVKVYYNFLNSKGERAFKDNEYTYIDGDLYDTNNNVSNTGLNSNSYGYINIIDNFSDLPFNNSDICAIEITIEGEEVTTFNATTTDIKIVDSELVGDTYSFTVNNNSDVNIYDGSPIIISKDNDGLYIDWAFVIEDYSLKPGESIKIETFISTLDLNRVSETFLLFDWSEVDYSSNSYSKTRSLNNADINTYNLIRLNERNSRINY